MTFLMETQAKNTKETASATGPRIPSASPTLLWLLGALEAGAACSDELLVALDSKEELAVGGKPNVWKVHSLMVCCCVLPSVDAEKPTYMASLRYGERSTATERTGRFGLAAAA